MKTKTVVMFAASQGGHLKELMGLRELFGKYHSVLVTDNLQIRQQPNLIRDFEAVEFSYAKADSRKQNAGAASNKSRWKEVFSYYRMFIECFKIFRKHKPSVVISTGSYIAVPLFIMAKIHRAKTIFIESNAMVYSKTTTGKLVEYFADKIYVQWPEMLEMYPKAEYHGVLH